MNRLQLAYILFELMVTNRQLLLKVLVHANFIHFTTEAQNNVHGVIVAACIVVGPPEKTVQNVWFLERLQDEEGVSKVVAFWCVVVNNSFGDCILQQEGRNNVSEANLTSRCQP
jgi:hypothetical protein